MAYRKVLGVLRTDYRERCEEKGHLRCADCTRCACDVDVSGRVSTDKYDDTLCPDCRYDRSLPT